MQRIYFKTLQYHLSHYRQMLFLTGPRQVGKTSLSQHCVEDIYEARYLNWDNFSDRALILDGMEAILSQSFGDTAAIKPRAIIFDEIHKYRQWKTLLKGYFDKYNHEIQFIVTGSAKLNIYRRGGDSMMGRYFNYRIHPLSVAECSLQEERSLKQDIQEPRPLDDNSWLNLMKFGGFPEPFLIAEETFYRRWQTLKQEQLFHEDLRELTHIHNIARLETLAHLLTEQVGGLIVYSELAKKIRITEPTVREWLDTLKAVYYCFTIQPWSKNISRSLLKIPKIYLWDWSTVSNLGARIENLVASHLLKAVHWWTDSGLGKYELFYLRDKEKREVDFLVVKNLKPWLMVEVKASHNRHASPHLKYFCEQLQVPHALQVVYELPYQELDCFSLSQPSIVPMRTFLSQLV